MEWGQQDHFYIDTYLAWLNAFSSYSKAYLNLQQVLGLGCDAITSTEVMQLHSTFMRKFRRNGHN
jgi:hypothetical protein